MGSKVEIEIPISIESELTLIPGQIAVLRIRPASI